MINTPVLSRYVVITRTSVSHIAFFIVSLFLLLPLLGIATSGVNDSPEELESLAEISYTHSSSSMNEPGFQEGSIFTRSTIAGGIWDTCVILDNSSVNCWGLLNTTSNDVYGTNINLTGNAVSIAIANQLSGAISGSADRCAIMEDSTTVCWQRDPSQFSPYTQDFGIGRNAVSLSGSWQRMCAILDDASLKCWGTNTYGQIGDGTYTSRSNPTSVNLGDNRSAVSVAVGYHHTCAILDNASLKCWGWNDDGQIGDGTTVTRTTPVHVDLGIGRKAVAITAGFSHTCAILDNGSAMCWGQGQQGNLGNGGYSDSSTPTQVSLPSGRTAIAIAGGTDHTCAILDNASIVCWGHNIYGQTGVPGGGSNQVQTTPVDVDLGLGRHAVAITSGGSHSCAVLDDASMKCWGQNSYGQLGTGDTTSSSTPASAALPTGRHIDLSERDIDGDGVLNIFDTHMKSTKSVISAGTDHSCSVLDDYSLYCWGRNNYGQLGVGTNTDSSTPVAVSLPSGRSASKVSAGTQHSCAVLDDDSLYCWGRNHWSQLGDGTTTDSSTPVAVSLPSGRTAYSVSVGSVHTCSVLDNNSLYCWGYNAWGALGDGTNSPSSTPVAVSLPSGRTAVSVSAGEYHTCALLDDSSMYCWGYNEGGQIGDGTTANRYTPVAVSLPGGRTVTSITVGGYYSCAVLDDASAYCWGYNSYGQLGDGTTTDSSTPVAVSLPSGRTVSSVDAGVSGSAHTCAVLDDASAYCWGYNIYGQLGDGTNSASSTPVAVSLPSGRTAVSVDSGASQTCAVLDNASLYCWGGNTYGQIGDGTTIGRTTPVAVSLPSGRTVIGLDTDLDGDGVVDTNDDYPSNPVRSISCPAGSYGRYVCIDSSAGHSAPTESMYDVECSAGTYQPSTGQASCIDASAGHYVLSTGSATQTICAAGTYQPSTGQTSCIDASAGYYVDGTGSTTQAACAAGTYNSNTASTSSSACTVASAGYYVADNSWTELLIDGDQSIASGQGHTCVILDDGSVSCWGYNYYGQLGDGTTNYRITPAQTASLGSGRTAVALSAGIWHTCAILDDGSVSCWGKNFRGQIGDGTNSHRYTPTQTASFGTGMTAVAISSGAEHTCAILNDGSVSCWGYNQWGQLGLGHPNDLNIPNQVNLSTGRTATALGTGWGHTCAVLDDGSVSCWGYNSYGQLGDGTTNDRWTPTQTASLGTGRAAVAISSGLNEHTCAILDDGSVSCWGSNQVGQLGDGTNTNRNSPTQTSSLGSGRTADAITTGGSRTCVILDNGSVSCWGSYVGDGTSADANTPTQTASLGSGRAAVAISAGQYHTCVILDNESVSCWGSNNYGELGDGTTNTNRYSPTQTSSLGTGRTALVNSIFYPHTGQSSQTACTAGTYQPSTGQTSCIDASAGYYSIGTKSIVDLSSGVQHSCSAYENSSLYCWGRNDYGQLGDGTTTDSSTPVQVTLPIGRTAVSVSLGSTHSCAVLDDDSIYCWGENGYSQLGDGTTTDSSTPVQVNLPSGRTAVSVTTGSYHTCAILDDASLHCWGRNNFGQLGDGTTSSSSTPAQVSLPSGRTVISADAGSQYTCAILDNALMYCWGYNSQGQLGIGSTSSSSTPVQVSLPSGHTVTSISVGHALTCAILNDGSMYCWGYNNNGGVGDGTTTDRSNPVEVSLPIGMMATSVSARTYHACAILDTSSLYCWGGNNGGALGNGVNYGQSTTPAQVISLSGSTVISVSTGDTHTCAVVATASPYCWGNNDYGQVGDGTTTKRNTPVNLEPPSSEIATSQIACLVGSYQPLTGQSSCVDASAGNYAYPTVQFLEDFEDGIIAGIWQTSSLATYPMTADSGSPISGSYSAMSTNQGVGGSASGIVISVTNMVNDTDTDGDGIADAASYSFAYSIASESGWDFLVFCIDNDANCQPALNYQWAWTARWSGLQSGVWSDTVDAGAHTFTWIYWKDSHVNAFTDTAWIDDVTMSAPISTTQTACAAGTYQPSTGQSSCISADAGYYVPSTGSTTQTICAAGTYQPSTGQSSCIDASAGYYVPSTGSATQTICATGTYQPSTGQISCIDASAGYYVDSTGSTTQTACSAGTYNSNTASTSSSACTDASAGYHVPSAGSATQTACAVGTYQSLIGQSSCIDASAGYYVPSTGSTTQTICATGTYQPSTGQSSCIDASAGYYVDSTGSTTQTACSAGTYNSNTASNSSSACIDASAGYYVPSTGSATQTICATGTYQPSTGQSSCIDASAGYYVPSTGSTTQTICAAGTYQPSTGQSSCIDASAGYYVPSTGSATQTICATGTYQPSTGQISCIDASAGYYVDSTGSTTQTACSAGTYNSNTASTSSSACTDASAGYHVPSAGSATQTACAVGTYQSLIGQSSCIDASAGYYVDTTASTTQTACTVGTYQPSTGQSSCIDASAGYYVPSTGSATQTICATGTYQPSTGQSSCIDASAGYYVDSTGSTTQIACSTGTYQPSTGQSSCIDASAGYYVDTTASINQTACAAGTYQPSTGQSSCIDADPGYFVPISGSANQTACSYGNYQPSSGQSSCIDASPGNYVDTNASIVQNPCIPGTYQPISGQSSCLDSDAGYYIATSGSVDQTPCDLGTFQELTGQVSCVDASAGYYVNTTASTIQIACPLGSYQPLTGQTSCLLATPGHYVPLNGSSTQTPCLAGTYNPLNGSFSQGDCIQASTGHHVPNEGSASQIECLAGYFQNITGQSSCNPADPGYFVPNNASWFQVGCTYGTYQPNSGQASCLDASPGHYVPGFASPTQTECALGSYQPQSGETSCISASIGYYVDQSASTNQTSCPPGTSTASTGSVSINDCYTDTDFDGIPDIIDPDDDNDGYLDDLDAFPLDPNEWDDTDNDGIGNNADLDDDGDGWSDITEIECGDSDPLNGTSTPADYDEDGVCNTLDDDDDNDSYPDSNDDFPLDDCAIIDTDGDGIPDWVFINCNTNLSEDIDDDNDGYNDTNDSHPLDPTEWFDTDNDGIGNNADTDDDGDNVPDQFDAFPLDSTEWMDTDGDGVGDNADTDNDDDGVLDTNDDFPNDANETTDTDGDGIGNNADDDDDGDGYLDIYDQFPLDSTEWFDTDLDGIGNNADPDDDGDGWTDNDEFICGSDELDANDVPDDSDGDGICDSEDDDSTGLAVIVDVVSNPLVVGLFLLIGAIIIVTLFLQSRNQSSRINELEGMIGNKTIIEDDELSND